MSDSTAPELTGVTPQSKRCSLQGRVGESGVGLVVAPLREQVLAVETDGWGPAIMDGERAILPAEQAICAKIEFTDDQLKILAADLAERIKTATGEFIERLGEEMRKVIADGGTKPVFIDKDGKFVRPATRS